MSHITPKIIVWNTNFVFSSHLFRKCFKMFVIRHPAYAWFNCYWSFMTFETRKKRRCKKTHTKSYCNFILVHLDRSETMWFHLNTYIFILFSDVKRICTSEHFMLNIYAKHNNRFVNMFFFQCFDFVASSTKSFYYKRST